MTDIISKFTLSSQWGMDWAMGSLPQRPLTPASW